jgi:hypothetical protein
MEGIMADIKRDQISDSQIEEAEEAADPSHEKIPANVEEDERGSSDVNK